MTVGPSVWKSLPSELCSLPHDLSSSFYKLLKTFLFARKKRLGGPLSGGRQISNTRRSPFTSHVLRFATMILLSFYEDTHTAEEIFSFPCYWLSTSISIR